MQDKDFAFSDRLKKHDKDFKFPDRLIKSMIKILHFLIGFKSMI